MVGVLSNSALIDLARLIAGFAVGMQLINNDSYISELTPRASRGRYMTTSFIFVLSAIPGAALLAALLVPHDPFGIAGWRYVVLFGSASGLVIWFIQRGLPESPRWLKRMAVSPRRTRLSRKLKTMSCANAASPCPRRIATMCRNWCRKPRGGRKCSGLLSSPHADHFGLPVRPNHRRVRIYGFRSGAVDEAWHQGRAFSQLHFDDRPSGSCRRDVRRLFLGTNRTQMAAGFHRLSDQRRGCSIALGTSVPIIVCAGALIALGNNWMISVFHPYAAELFPTRIRARASALPSPGAASSSILSATGSAIFWPPMARKPCIIMIGAAMLSIIVGIGVFGPKTNGQALETLSP